MLMMQRIREWAKTQSVVTIASVQRNFPDVGVRSAGLFLETLKKEGCITEDWDASEGGYVVLGRQANTACTRPAFRLLPNVRVSEDGHVAVDWNPANTAGG